MEKNAVISLIDRYLRGETTEPENVFIDNYTRSFQQADAWDESREGSRQQFLNSILEDLKGQIKTESTNAEPTTAAPIHRIHFLKRSWTRYAAAIILLIAGISTVLVLQPWKTKAPQQMAATPINDIKPGSKQAYITLGNGKTVPLDQIKVGERVGEAVKAADGKLVYQNLNSNAQTISINTITVPRGGEPRFVELADHTLAWLNAESSITYPTTFTGDIREISMTGEVYLEVAKEANHRRFFAQTPTDRIEVKGTKFNIRAYADEPFVKTTLFEGSVKIGNVLLAPGEQHENGRIRKVDDAEQVRILAWKNGLFSYDKVDVQTLMRDLGRYYDMEVVFEGTPTKRTYEGKIGRSLTLKDVLDGLHFTELNYRLEKGSNGNRIVMLP